MKEIWKPVVGYEDLYHVSNLGNVKSLSRVIMRTNGVPIRITQRILKPGNLKSPGGNYKVVMLCNHGNDKTFLVHTLVCEAFLRKPVKCENLTINHKNENKSDNRVLNLEWCSHRENNTHWKKFHKTSKYYGVFRRKGKSKWTAVIKKSSKAIYLGLFITEEDAYRAVKNAEIRLGITNKYS